MGREARANPLRDIGVLLRRETDLEHHLDVWRQSISKLLNGSQGLSTDMATRFQKAFGLKAETLMRMQAAHALAEARALHGEMAMLEEELGGLLAGGAYRGPGDSPDRADAMVWALGEVMVERMVRVRVRGFEGGNACASKRRLPS